MLIVFEVFQGFAEIFIFFYEAHFACVTLILKRNEGVREGSKRWSWQWKLEREKARKGGSSEMRRQSLQRKLIAPEGRDAPETYVIERANMVMHLVMHGLVECASVRLREPEFVSNSTCKLQFCSFFFFFFFFFRSI